MDYKKYRRNPKELNGNKKKKKKNKTKGKASHYQFASVEEECMCINDIEARAFWISDAVLFLIWSKSNKIG